MLKRVLDELNPTEFENLTYDLLRSSGMRNLTWRTPGSDVGRDIEGEYRQVDFSGLSRTEHWFIDCKRYGTSISWPVVWEKIAYADSLGADSLLIVTQSTFSPQCIDQVNLWNNSQRRPSIRLWPIHELTFRLSQVPYVALKYGLTDQGGKIPAALAPISQQLARMTIAAGDNLTFLGTSSRYMDAAVALSQFIMVRTEDFENSGKIVKRTCTDQYHNYSWATSDSGIILNSFDGPYIRTIIPLISIYTRSENVILSLLDERTLCVTPSSPRTRPFSEMDKLIALVDTWGLAHSARVGNEFHISAAKSAS